MKPLILVAAPLALVFLASCFGSNCSNRKLSLRYSGFDSGSLAGAIVRQYEPGSNFSKLMQTDTDKIVSMSKYIVLDEGADWEVELPRSGRKDRVKDISHKKNNKRTILPSGGSSYDAAIIFSRITTMAGTPQWADLTRPIAVEKWNIYL